MWRAVRQIYPRKPTNNIREPSCLHCHVHCPSRRKSIYVSGKREAVEYSRFNGLAFVQGGNRQGFCVEDSVRTSLDATMFFNSAWHLPSVARTVKFGSIGGITVEPPWPPPGTKAFASTAVEAVVSSDVDEEAFTSSDEGRGQLNRLKSNNIVREVNRNQNSEVGERTMSKAKYQALRKRQMQLESDAWESAAQEYRELMADMCAHKLAPNLPYVKSLFLGWFEPLRDAIAAEQDQHESRKFKTTYGEYLLQLPADMLAVITMHKVMGLLMTGQDDCSVQVVRAAIQIGDAVEQEVKVHNFLEKTKKKPQKKTKNEGEEEQTVTKEQQFIHKRLKDLMTKQKGRIVRTIVKNRDDSKPWGHALQAKVGSRLIELLLQATFIQPPVDQSAEGPPEIRPAFKHRMKTVLMEQKVVKRYGVIECDPLVRRGVERTARHMVIPYMPMLVKPIPWTGYNKGGYLILPSNVMRTHGANQQREAMKRVQKRQVERVYQALDILGSTKWRINKRILDVVDRLWAGGGRLADLVDREDVSIPEKPDTEDEAEIKRWKWRLRKAKKTNSERHSQRCDVELKLAVARKMKDEEYFYYPHNLDFRGRAYPMHPYLNHLGSDMCRGILEFGEGRPLGKTGFYWLKIHLANLYGGGVDKYSFEGRLTFVEDNINKIIDSAEMPLEGERWWLEAEDPFQCLSACMDLTDALKSSSPETAISHIPVHQDGSCNGLQHYAALGRDMLGAVAVNLVGGQKPADVYSGIAARVDEIMQRDALKDPATDRNAECARILLGQVDRKLVKQTVMTSVYGVTYIGARDQIRKRLKERGLIADEVALFSASCYAAKTTLTALGEMFNAARSIMTWLGDCAKIIASENQPVQWTTPLGLPVIQPYRKFGRQLVKTSLQVLALRHETDKVMVNRQKSAFPPNFVHSLDGSHMMMTALACKEAGLSFAGVHDSYWTHAANAEEMNRILREKFVELYSAPILENLLKSFETSFPKLVFPPLPERGDYELNEVLNSPYFFN